MGICRKSYDFLIIASSSKFPNSRSCPRLIVVSRPFTRISQCRATETQFGSQLRKVWKELRATSTHAYKYPCLLNPHPLWRHSWKQMRWYNLLCHGTVRYGMTWGDMTCYDMVWHARLYDMLWYGRKQLVDDSWHVVADRCTGEVIGHREVDWADENTGVGERGRVPVGETGVFGSLRLDGKYAETGDMSDKVY